jgi:protein-disulfide isomerase
MTIGGLVIGVAIVAILAFNQLGGRGGDDLIEPTGTYPDAIVDGTALGSPDAPVVMEVFEDFQCPVCARHSLTVEPVLVARYVNNGTLRIVHRDLAFLGNESVLAASAATCALDQDAYFDMALWMYENQGSENRGGFRRERLDQMAERAGLDMGAYATCMDDPATQAEVDAKTREITGMGINSTPTVRINGGTPIVGLQTADALGTAIEAAAAAASPAP